MTILRNSKILAAFGLLAMAGCSGSDGTDGVDGQPGAPGAQGPEGPTGEMGTDGEPYRPPQPPVTDYAPRTRTYYIAAEEVMWNYAPQDMNVMMARAFTEDEEVFVGADPANGFIGATYLKVQYIEYTDASFMTRKTIEPKWEHLGLTGPVIRGVVGDVLEVVFKNNASRGYTMHPHGVFYDKDSEGAPYDDGTGGVDKADDNVAPGATHTYTWEVPETAGPGPADASSIVWLYHSHANEPADTNAGLYGAIIITHAGWANDDATPVDVDVEIVNMFSVYDENASWYIEDQGVTSSVAEGNPDFEESNLMHGINGYLYGATPRDGVIPMQAKVGDRVRWYLLSLGTEVDLHTPHWHGNTTLYDGHRTDVVELLPASMKVVDMKAVNPGIWMYHCHVNDHIAAGMATRFQINP